MKKMIVFYMLTILTGNSFAADSIKCSDGTFSVNINILDEISSDYFETIYTASGISLNGPRLPGYEFETTVKKTKIQTRVVYGDGYHLELPNGEVIDLEEIIYSADPARFAVGFTGKYKKEDHVKNLNCSRF